MRSGWERRIFSFFFLVLFVFVWIRETRLQKTLLMLFVLFPQRNICSVPATFIQNQAGFLFYPLFLLTYLSSHLCIKFSQDADYKDSISFRLSSSSFLFLGCLCVAQGPFSATQLLFYKHIVTVVVQRAVVSSDHRIAPDKPETHATALRVFKIVKPW